jgi:hypothetical protein
MNLEPHSPLATPVARSIAQGDHSLAGIRLRRSQPTCLGTLKTRSVFRVKTL